MTYCGKYRATNGASEAHSMGNILIIDDDDAIRKSIASVLELEGYSTSSASDGKQALEMIRAGQIPDIILLDMMMPVMNGWAFLDFLRANANTAQIPVVVVSAFAESAKSVRPHAFVPKPVQLKALLNTIQSFVA